MKNKEMLIKNSNSIDANTIATNLLAQQRAESYLETHLVEDEYAEFSGLDASQKSSVSNIIAQNATEGTDAYDKDKGKYDRGLVGISWLGFNNYSDADIQKAYAGAMGYQEDVTNKSGYGVYRDKDGKTFEVDDDTARNFLKSEAALQNASDKVNEYIATSNSLADKGTAAAQLAGIKGQDASDTGLLLSSFYGGSGDLSGAKQEQINALKNMIGQDGFKATDLISDEDAKEAGKKDAQDFVNGIQEELKTYNPEVAAVRNAQEEQNEYNTAIKNAAEACEVSETAMEDYVDKIQDANPALKSNTKASIAAAKQSFNFADGLEELGNALNDDEQLLKDWKNGLTESTEAYEAVAKVQDALKKMFGVKVSTDFVKEHLEDLEKLANGDTSALEELQKAASRDYLVSLELDQASLDKMNSLTDQIAEKDITIGTSLDDSSIINGLNEMLSTGKMTAEEMQSYLNSLGYDPDIQYKTEMGEPQRTVTDTTYEIAGVKMPTVHAETVSQTSTQIPYIANSESGKSGLGTVAGSGLTKTSTTNMLANSVKNSGASGKKVGSGGSGSGGSKTTEDLNEDKADRYEKVNAQLALLSDKLSKLQSQEEKLMGKQLIENLSKQLATLNQQIDKTNEKLAIANQEQAELQNKLRGYGAGFESNGVISNYMSMFSSEQNRLNSAINTFNASGQSDSDKNALEAAKKRFDEFKELITDYDELVTNTIPGLEDDIQSAIDSKIEKQIQAFNIQIEVRLEISEALKE